MLLHTNLHSYTQLCNDCLPPELPTIGKSKFIVSRENKEMKAAQARTSVENAKDVQVSSDVKYQFF